MLSPALPAAAVYDLSQGSQLRCCRETHRGPVVLLVESLGGGAKLARELSMLSEVPFADAAAHSIDCAYPSIGWQARAVRTAVFRIIQGSGHLKVGQYGEVIAPTKR